VRGEFIPGVVRHRVVDGLKQVLCACAYALMQRDDDKGLSSRPNTTIILYYFVLLLEARARVSRRNIRNKYTVLYNIKRGCVSVHVCVCVCVYVQRHGAHIIIIILMYINTGPRRCADDMYVRVSFRVMCIPYIVHHSIIGC
jgi:hypothetical protein